MADALAVTLPVTQTDDDYEDEEEEEVEEEVVVVEEEQEDEDGGDEDESDAALRAYANSPRGDSDHLAPAAGDATAGKATPNTLRNTYDVNSPRKKGTHSGWAGANEDDEADGKVADGSGPPPGFITQVSKPDPSSVMTQVPRPDAVDVEDGLADLAPQPGSWGLLDCFMCCGSPPDVQQKMKQEATKQHPVKPAGEAASSRTALVSASGAEVQTGDDSDSECPAGLLPPMSARYKGKKCLVLDLDETLVHSSFKPVQTCDFVIPVEIEGVVHRVYVLKRPHVDEFLRRCAVHYEVVIFTASLAKYADPLLDKLDIHNVIQHRLFRDSCVLHGTAYVKDLTKLGRKMRDTIIVDNSPQSYIFQPDHAVPIASWFDDPTDTQLDDFLPVLETTMKDVYDVGKMLDANKKSFRWLCNQAHKDPKIFQ